MEGVGYIIGAVLLGLAIAYGLFQYSRRDRRKDALTEDATRQVYDNYEKARRDPDHAPEVLRR